jgi:hypothetical protein
MIKEIDLTTDAEYDLEINRNVDLDQTIVAETYSGDTKIGIFQLSGFTGAILVAKVRRDSDFDAFTLDSDNGEIILGNNGEIQIIKSASDIKSRAGEYVYNMYLLDGSVRYAFLKGKFTINEYSTI